MKKFRKAFCAFLAAVLTVTVNGGTAVMAEDEIPINEMNFPDPILRQQVIDNVDANDNGCLSYDEIAVIKTYQAYEDDGVTDLTGMEYFFNLEWLVCTDCDLDKLDVSGNPKLKVLVCDNNDLTALDLSNNTKLEKISCKNNSLEDIVLADMPQLEIFDCSNNKLMWIDLGKCPGLTAVNVSHNNMLAVDLSKNTKLIGVNVSNNLLSQLDVSMLSELEWIRCGGNCITYLDLSANSMMTNLDCSDNFLTNLDLSNNTQIDISDSYFSDNIYFISPENGCFDLSCMPKGFDISRASDWKGAVCENGMLTNITGIGGDRITYSYDIGDAAHTLVTFALYFGEGSEPEPAVYYPITAGGNVYVDRASAAAGESVNVKADIRYDIIVTDDNGLTIAAIRENGSFVMPACKVNIRLEPNGTGIMMSASRSRSYVFSYDKAMNRLAVHSDKDQQGVIVIDLGAEYAGREFTIYSGRKNSSVKVTSGVLDKNGRFTFEADEGKNYSLIV